MPADVSALMKLEVPVIVQIAGREMHVDEVINLAPGAIIELPKLADEPLDILVSNKQIGLGAAVKVGENFGIRVTYVGNATERIRAMGGELGEVEEPDAASDEATQQPVPEEAAA